MIPILAAAQWIVGLLAAIIAVGRSRRYGRSGGAPRLLARIAMIIFVIAAVVVLVASTPARRLLAPLFPPEFTGESWRAAAFLKSSLPAWVLVVVSALWNWMLGVSLRRRRAAAELGRRTARVMAHRRDDLPPPVGGGESRGD
ncbi:MAG TPA: hypothetical protein VF488_12725 [Gemmatimonadaceae bacterium]